MPKQVTVAEAAEMMKEGWKYVDVRSVPEFQAGHPEGAVNVPLLHAQSGRMIPNPDFQPVMQGNFTREDKLLVGCKMGGRAAQAAAILEAAGFTSIVQVRGGFSGERDNFGKVSAPGWSDSGLPVAKQASAGASYDELATKRG